MKIKLDENLPASLIADLGRLGHDVDSAPEEGLAGHADPEVWAAAQATGRFLITQDLDFFGHSSFFARHPSRCAARTSEAAWPACCRGACAPAV